jgi:uridine phosphorylase
MSKPIKDTDLIIRPDGGAFHIGLTANQVPQKIIAVGDPDRVAMVSRYFDKVDFKVTRREFVSHGGTFQGKDVLAISTGIGPDNVEIMLTELDSLVNVDLKTRLPKANPTRLSIVRVGTSGALQADIAVGSELVSATAVGLDNLMNFYSLPQTKSETDITTGIQQVTGLSFLPYMADCSSILLDKIGFDMTKGNTMTCPGFYAPQGRQVRLDIRYPNLLDHLTTFRNGGFRLTNFEMETSTYYAFGQLLGHDMLSTNSILVNRAKNVMASDAEKAIDGLIRKVLERI